MTADIMNWEKYFLCIQDKFKNNDMNSFWKDVHLKRNEVKL